MVKKNIQTKENHSRIIYLFIISNLNYTQIKLLNNTRRGLAKKGKEQ